MDLYAFDDAYVRRLQEGDPWTEEHFTAYFQQLLLIKLRSRLRSAQAVEDVMQEVFVRVFRTLRAEGLRDGRKLGAFVNSVCNNVLMETFRAGSRSEGLRDEHQQLPDPDVDVEQSFATAETKDRVRRVLTQLETEQPKDAKLLRGLFLEDRDKDELCRELGVDRGYLRVLLHRAKEKFRSEYLHGKVVRFGKRETGAGKTSLRS